MKLPALLALTVLLLAGEPRSSATAPPGFVTTAVTDATCPMAAQHRHTSPRPVENSTAEFFDPPVQGHTDRFILRVRHP